VAVFEFEGKNHSGQESDEEKKEKVKRGKRKCKMEFAQVQLEKKSFCPVRGCYIYTLMSFSVPY